MSPLEVLQLVGYSIGAALPLWLGLQLVSRRHRLSSLERVLFALAVGIGCWHFSNLLITFYSLFGLHNWTLLLRVADSVAVTSITLVYSFLLHVHLHLWANASGRPLTRNEKIRVYLSYLPALFLLLAVPPIWSGAYAPMLTKLSAFVLPFAIWVAYVLGLIATTELLIARRSSNPSEQRMMRTLAASFVAVGMVILGVLALGVGEGTSAGAYLKTIANLGSLLPSVLLAYYIYRYRYLELIIKESLIVASFAAVVLVIYLYFIRALAGWVTRRYGLREGVLEALMILGLTLAAAPLRGWLERRFHNLFQREAAFYRQIVSRIGTQAGDYRNLQELLRFIEERTIRSLGLRRVRIVVAPERPLELPGNGDLGNAETIEPWIQGLLEEARTDELQVIEEDPSLQAHGYKLAYPLRREDRVAGIMLVDGASGSLTVDARAVLEILSGQVAVAIEDCRLVEENLKLERRLAERERLAVLGQMAATVAHEIKNPLSAIKSIAQVMREEAKLTREYARDLSLIVGETDRLNESVTQLLSFARKETPAAAPQRVDKLIESVVQLFYANVQEVGGSIQTQIETRVELSGSAVSAVRDALSNLLLNALQATGSRGEIAIVAREENGELKILVSDNGPGVPVELHQRIWEPFFTTKQRGTGLGLAIVRKRMEEAGGLAQLVAGNGNGACFELSVTAGPSSGAV